jgi:hypothetical protein
MRIAVRGVVVLATIGALLAPGATSVFAAGISVNPGTGAIGTSTSVSGSGFAANTTVHVFFNRNGGKQIGAESTDGSGNLPGFNVTIPSVIAGSYPIIATDGTNVATTTFTVPSSLTLNPSSGGSGTSVSVMGAGYLAGEGIVVSWDHPGQGNQVAAPTADSSGTFITSFSVPSSSGTHTVFATGRSSHFALSAVFAVSGNVGGANLTISPTSGAAGTAVSVNGSGFGASEQVTLALDGTNAFSVTSDGSGNFGTSLTLPSTSALGTHTISAAGVGSGHTALSRSPSRARTSSRRLVEATTTRATVRATVTTTTVTPARQATNTRTTAMAGTATSTAMAMATTRGRTTSESGCGARVSVKVPSGSDR